MRYLYSAAFLLYLLLTAPWLLARIAAGRYRESILPRLGIGIEPLPAAAERAWIHACSVGEVEAAAPLVEKIRREWPETRLVISTVTETGAARARKVFADLDFRYLPFDLGLCVRRHLDAAGPLRAFFIMETEIWPNLLTELHRRGVPIFIANGRISDRAWPRYRRFAFIFRPLLAMVKAVAARSEADAERFRAIGAARVVAVGNIKFDRPPAARPVDPPSGRFIVFGSTHPGEEEICLEVFRALRETFNDLRAILAPRHIERAASLAHLGALRRKGWKDESVLILDTHGELAGMYSIAEVAFVGGSLVPHGGHNPLEAAVHGVPTVWGPHVQNFRDACGLLDGRGGYCVRDAVELAATLRRLLADSAERTRAGEEAKRVVAANRGAVERTWEVFVNS